MEQTRVASGNAVPGSHQIKVQLIICSSSNIYWNEKNTQKQKAKKTQKSVRNADSFINKTSDV